MTRDEHKGIIQRLLGMTSPEQQAAASDLLTQLSDDYEETLTNAETLTATNQTLTANNETLREVNAKLFLRVGETHKTTHKQEAPPENDPPKLTYDALFNEKGELI